jgi:hypothetical protein
MYEVMRYWDDDRPEWNAEQHEFAAAWRSQPKWVVSRSLKSVGPNAKLVSDDIEAVIQGLKARFVGEIAVSGPDLARNLPTSVLSISIDSTSILSCLVTASRSSLVLDHRSALRRAIVLARM